MTYIERQCLNGRTEVVEEEEEELQRRSSACSRYTPCRLGAARGDGAAAAPLWSLTVAAQVGNCKQNLKAVYHIVVSSA